MGPRQLIEVERARAIVVERSAALPCEEVALEEALGRAICEEVRAAEPVPAFDGSAMDGYAVLAADTAGATPERPAALRLAGESRAGAPAPTAVEAGEAVAISTGAVVPHGADAVVRVEVARREGDRILVQEEVREGRDIRRAGEDVAVGAVPIAAGTELGPAELGVIASLGRSRVSCRRRPRVAVLTSGDELLEPAEPMRPGGVRNSNKYSVAALVRGAGAELTVVRGVEDDAAATRTALEPALTAADVVVLCGGVSVGEHDHVKPALAALGVEQAFWGLALKPGKPTWFGSRGATLVFGLPGNPVSTVVGFLLLARPALLALSGRDPFCQRLRARLASPYEKPAGRAHAVPCRIEPGDGRWTATLSPPRGSHVLTALLGADGLAIVPAGAERLGAGEEVEVELLPGRGA